MKKVSDEFIVGKNNIGWVDRSFTSEFGNDDLTEGKALSFQKLTRTMRDEEIISELKIQDCTLADVLVTLNSAPEELKDGYSNIFYIKGHSRVVHVFWGVGEWSVCDWVRGGYWGEGSRVFSPATGTKTLGSGSSETLTLKNVCECERCERCGKLIK